MVANLHEGPHKLSTVGIRGLNDMIPSVNMRLSLVVKKDSRVLREARRKLFY